MIEIIQTACLVIIAYSVLDFRKFGVLGRKIKIKKDNFMFRIRTWRSKSINK